MADDAAGADATRPVDRPVDRASSFREAAMAHAVASFGSRGARIEDLLSTARQIEAYLRGDAA